MPRALLIHAHPDDEAFANSGRVLELVAGGYEVHAAVATAGEASEPDAADLKAARIRRLDKYQEALEALGIQEWMWLDDTAPWVDEPEGPLVADADPATLSEAVQRTIRACRPDLILTVGRDGLTGHPDHIAIAKAVRTVASSDPVPQGYWGASLRTADVQAGHRLASRHARGRPVGSGRVTGTTGPTTLRHVAPYIARRRALLDIYRAGLGTAPLPELMAGSSHLGDSILLRATFDATHLATEHYRRVGDAPR